MFTLYQKLFNFSVISPLILILNILPRKMNALIFLESFISDRDFYLKKNFRKYFRQAKLAVP